MRRRLEFRRATRHLRFARERAPLLRYLLIDRDGCRAVAAGGQPRRFVQGRTRRNLARLELGTHHPFHLHRAQDPVPVRPARKLAAPLGQHDDWKRRSIEPRHALHVVDAYDVHRDTSGAVTREGP